MWVGELRDEQRRQPDSPVEEEERREVTIETTGDQGNGIAKGERGYVVIVPGANPGDEPIVELEEVRPNVTFASVVDPDPRTLYSLPFGSGTSPGFDCWPGL